VSDVFSTAFFNIESLKVWVLAGAVRVSFGYMSTFADADAVHRWEDDILIFGLPSIHGNYAFHHEYQAVVSCI